MEGYSSWGLFDSTTTIFSAFIIVFFPVIILFSWLIVVVQRLHFGPSELPSS